MSSFRDEAERILSTEIEDIRDVEAHTKKRLDALTALHEREVERRLLSLKNVFEKQTEMYSPSFIIDDELGRMRRRANGEGE